MGFLAVFRSARSPQRFKIAAGGRKDAGGTEGPAYEENWPRWMGGAAPARPLTTGVLPADEVLVGLQQPQISGVVDCVLQRLHGELGRLVGAWWWWWWWLAAAACGAGAAAAAATVGGARKQLLPAGAAGCAASAAARRSPSGDLRPYPPAGGCSGARALAWAGLEPGPGAAAAPGRPGARPARRCPGIGSPCRPSIDGCVLVDA